MSRCMQRCDKKQRKRYRHRKHRELVLLYRTFIGVRTVESTRFRRLMLMWVLLPAGARPSGAGQRGTVMVAAYTMHGMLMQALAR